LAEEEWIIVIGLIFFFVAVVVVVNANVVDAEYNMMIMIWIVVHTTNILLA
jgi:hypothetical protein